MGLGLLANLLKRFWGYEIDPITAFALCKSAYEGIKGCVAVIVPAAECGLTIEEIAAKDVPAGKPYKIVDVADIPTDRTFRNAWEFSE